MGIIVQKFGGSSVKNTEMLFNICDKIITAHNSGDKVVIVVSAQGKMTDMLVKEAAEISKLPNEREMDVLLSTGEQISVSKLAMCLQEKGYDAISLTGWQAGIITDSNNGNSRILHIHQNRITEELEKNRIVIVAGFQGINERGDITTLGRGGSDTTAVALATALKARRCEIYTDVDGIYTADPRIIDTKKKLSEISYDEMLEMANLGAKVLHNRCVEVAKEYNVPLLVKSSFNNNEGTLIGGIRKLEDVCISGIAKDDNIAVIRLKDCDSLYELFKLLKTKNICIDMLTQHENNIAFTVAGTKLNKLVDAIIEEKLGTFTVEQEVSKISVVGAGLVNNPEISEKIFKVLHQDKLKIYLSTTSETKISVIVDKDLSVEATKDIHDQFFNLE